MTYELPTLALTNHDLDRAGFGTKTLAEHALPETPQFAEAADGTQVPYVVFGDSHEAGLVIPVPVPYTTRLMAPHYLLSLKAKQAALGDFTAVVGIQTFHPDDQPLNLKQRSQASAGSFAPLVERELAVLEELGLKDGQFVYAAGHSLGADVTVELAHGNRFSPHKGVLDIVGIGVNEAARTGDRSLVSMITAFKNSGGSLLGNIIESDCPALLEAWGLPADVTETTAAKAFNKRLESDAVRYTLANIRSNLALTRGFSTATTRRLLRTLVPAVDYPVSYIRSADSQVSVRGAYDELEQMRTRQPEQYNHLFMAEVAGDHAGDDHLRNAAAALVWMASNDV